MGGNFQIDEAFAVAAITTGSSAFVMTLEKSSRLFSFELLEL